MFGAKIMGYTACITAPPFFVCRRIHVSLGWKVVTEGIALAFVATALMPGGWVFALIFFVMLFLLGIGTQFGLVSIFRQLSRTHSRKYVLGSFEAFLHAAHLFRLLLAGSHRVLWEWFMLDAFTGSVGIPLCAAMGLPIVCYIYGICNFIIDIDELFGKPSNFVSRWVFGTRPPYFIITWMFCAPVIGVVVFGYQTFMLILNIFSNTYNVPGSQRLVYGTPSKLFTFKESHDASCSECSPIIDDMLAFVAERAHLIGGFGNQAAQCESVIADVYQIRRNLNKQSGDECQSKGSLPTDQVNKATKKE
ncbi:unnamed protein product, partial [Mesorhabditis belari]|uniref:Uncharacterized protein n=1 Tax=Mesorhabditis belari TaxID=2138241 RepID=A0AAF3FLN3_9BILA